MRPAPSAGRSPSASSVALGNRPRKPRRVHAPRHNAHPAAIRLEQRRDHRVEHQHRLGLAQRLPQLGVILLRPDARQLALGAMQRPGMPPALGQAAATNVGRGKLVARALLDLVRPGRQQPQVIERADILLGLVEQVIGIAAYRLGQIRLHVPGIGDHDVIGRKRIDGLAKPCLNRGDVPARVVKRNRLARADQCVGDAPDAPARKLGKEVLHLIPRPSQKRRQLRRMMIPAASRRPVEQKAQNRHAHRPPAGSPPPGEPGYRFPPWERAGCLPVKGG